MKIKKILSSLLASTMLFGSVSANAVTVETDDMPKASGAAVETFPSRDAATVNSGPDALAIKNGVIFHAWSWSFNTITQHLDEIAAAGYTAIQTSPPSECYSVYNSKKLMGADHEGTDGAWWWYYQPTKLAIGNDPLGTRADYIAMCEAAETKGIKIIADIVSNHTTAHYTRDEKGNEVEFLYDDQGNQTGRGQIDVDDEFIEAVGGYESLYHQDGFEDVENIENPTREQVINYRNGGLPDINTENPKYQAYLIEYMNDLIACGCDGFRFDTAKIIGVKERDGSQYDFWNAVTGQKTISDYKKTENSAKHNVTLGDTNYDNNVEVPAANLFYYGEILNDHSYDSYYRKYIAVTDDTYSYYIREAVRSGDVSTSCIHSLDPQSVVWVESHDTYSNDSHYTAKMLTEDNIKLNWAIITARKIGTPLFYNRPEGSDALNGNYWGTNILGNKGNDQFKDPEIVAVNKFRTAMVGTDEAFYNLNNNKIIQIDRCSSSLDTYGSCIVNVGDAYEISNARTQLKTGTYVDAVTGHEFEVTSGESYNLLSGSVPVPARSVTVLYPKVNYQDTVINAVTSVDTFDHKLDVQMTLKNAKQNTTGSYTVEADNRVIQSGTFNDGDVITIGGSVTVTDRVEKNVKLTLSAQDSNNLTVTRIYNYKKTSSQDITLYLDSSSSVFSDWSGRFYADIYLDDTSRFKAWPGTEMTYDTNTGYYKVDVPSAYKRANVKFIDQSNTSNKYPPSGTTLKLTGKTQVFTNNKLTDYDPNPDNNSSITTDNYIYFLNTIAPANSCSATLLDSSGSTDVSMSYSEDMHCYYLKYDSTQGYTKVQFTDNVNVQTGFVDLQPGMVFTTTSYNGGEWISPNSICEHTIYFTNNNNVSWSNVYAYLWNGTESRPAAWPGVQMKNMGSVAGINGTIYSLTYYYPRISGGNSDYTFVIFNNGLSGSSGKQTVDLKIPVSGENKTYLYSCGSTNSSGKYLCDRTEMKDSVQVEDHKIISVTFNYYDEKISPGADSNKYVERTYSKTVEVYADSNGIKNVIANAKEGFNDNNRYDTYYVETSQLDYVTNIASRTNSSRIKNNLNYCSKINPKFFAHQTSALSSVNDSTIGNLQTAQNNAKWITYKNGNDTIEYSDIKPDFSNVTSVELWAFSMPKEYDFSLYYPNTVTQVSEVCDSGLYLSDSNCVDCVKANYNQLGSSSNKYAKDMKNPNGYVFDGWYILEHPEGESATVENTTGYIKVSSSPTYNYRQFIDNLELYALFKKSNNNTQKEGCAAVPGDVDIFTDSNVSKLRLNTYLNVFNVSDKKKITDVGVVYVKLSGAVSTATLKQDISADAASGELGTLRKSVSSCLSGDTANISNSYQGKSANYMPYVYATQYNADPNAQNKTQLTNKNRLQFILTLSQAQVSDSYSNVLAFTAYKIGDGDWQISSNCVYYENGNPNLITLQ